MAMVLRMRKKNKRAMVTGRAPTATTSTRCQMGDRNQLPEECLVAEQVGVLAGHTQDEITEVPLTARLHTLGWMHVRSCMGRRERGTHGEKGEGYT
jgi:hypothetical protein